MEKMEERFRQILEGATEVFMKYGIRSVTMDDVARHLGVSKKTLYKYVKDKKDLVLQGMKLHQEDERCAMEACVKKGLNAIDENFEISKVIVEQLKNIHPSVMFDLTKYYPEVMIHFEEYKQKVIKAWVSDNLRRGMEEGLYRDDLNVDIITGLYLVRMNDWFQEGNFPAKYSFKDLYLETFRYHIRGVASEKGVKYLQEKVKKEHYS